jgi:hypothetical protein
MGKFPHLIYEYHNIWKEFLAIMVIQLKSSIYQHCSASTRKECPLSLRRDTKNRR